MDGLEHVQNVFSQNVALNIMHAVEDGTALVAKSAATGKIPPGGEVIYARFCHFTFP